MSLKVENCLLYAVTDTSWLRGRTLAQQVEEALRGGATMVQLREKELQGEALEQEAREILALCRQYGVPLLINDDVMLAKKIGADGVHVGQDDMSAAKARELLGEDAVIGVTARTVEQALAAQEAGADYLGSGAVFGTSTKKDAKPMDPAYFQQICESVSIPVVAIGGVTLDNIRELEGRKMCGFAIVSGIFAAEDIESRTRDLWKAAQELCLPGQVSRLKMEILRRHPVVQCITNIVTVNDCANALLAVGASPTMAHHPEEMEEFAAVCDALVCNMGATESLEAMMAAGKADTAGPSRPVVIDPVGCATSAFRRRKCLELIDAVHPACIRGNGAEIRALATDHRTARGVDDLFLQEKTEGPADKNGQSRAEISEDQPSSDFSLSEETVRCARQLSRMTGAIVIASGETDFVVSGDRVYSVHGGSAWMTRVTGTGCMLSVLLGAFLSVENSALSAAACCGMMNVCAERAQEHTAAEHGGTGTFRVHLIDELSGSIRQ
ncbi:thiamine-phosphate diphosphorylase / hydroxyethylthiazole kinase [Sarcina sp. DSM 11001]|uniref:thiamine phosphate synthase n=1 Tax=Sarcina sp. DSM 11001 TaxID=1798184 RepID=UPI00088854EA|nr:thiamine-phosphate diphosphorylase / hydroxyethylthiazole kinase [Sarcina sp. DSM 11001]